MFLNLFICFNLVLNFEFFRTFVSMLDFEFGEKMLD